MEMKNCSSEAVLLKGSATGFKNLPWRLEDQLAFINTKTCLSTRLCDMQSNGDVQP